MEKVKLGFEMATRWSDPTICLIGIVPFAIWWLGSTGFFLYHALLMAQPYIEKSVMPEGEALQQVGIQFALVFLPQAITYFVWNFLYHSFFEDKSVDTSKYVTFRDASLQKYWKHRKIPMCELYEFYIREQCDWNPKCENGDCYLILHRHREEFVNYKTTWRQISWLYSQFFPAWMTCGVGLGHGSSSGKSIEETTKEIDEHYNKGNDVFSCILGRAMVYTCGIFHGVPEFAATGHKGDYAASADDGTLEQAQFNKMNMICDKIMLKKGETLLDIGCGWGTLIRHAVSEYGAIATGVTLSREGKIYCDLASKKTGIDTEVLLCDYRLIPQDQQFDKITCIEMAEHVGIANFVDPYLKNIRRLLKNKDSLFCMQVAGLRQGSNWQDVAWGLFMGKYVFPGADASTPLNWYIRQCELAGFEIHSVETIGIHYSHTLHKWYDNWMSHKDMILAGDIDAISEHSKGAHLFRLNEITWAWCTIHAGQGGGTCYQIIMNPCQYDFPRDIWVDGEQVSDGSIIGVGMQNKIREPINAKERFENERSAGHKSHLNRANKASTPKAKAVATPIRRNPPRSAKK